MISSKANLKLYQFAMWSGYIYIAFLMIGIWLLADFFPSQPPTWNVDEIGDLYRNNYVSIRIGMVFVLFGSMFYVPWTAILAKMLSHIEGGAGILTYSQIISGTTNVLLTAYPAGWWLIASFRLDRDPQLMVLLNDIGWLQFLGVITPFYFVVITLIIGSLADESEDPLFPRWVGYFNSWFLVTLIPLNIIYFFKSGPFAWNGIFGFYLPFIIFWFWFVVMTHYLRKAVVTLHAKDELQR